MHFHSRRSRIVGAVVGVLALAPGYALGEAGLIGRGGVFALGIAVTFLGASSVLLWRAGTGRYRSASERGRWRLLSIAAALAVLSYGCILLGIRTHPGANIPGVIGVVGGAIYTVAVPATAIALLGWLRAFVRGDRLVDEANRVRFRRERVQR